MIEPLRERLINPPIENLRQEDSVWLDSLVNQVKHSELELVANFTDIPLRLSKSPYPLKKGMCSLLINQKD